MKLRAALAVTATILAGAVGMGGLSGCALPTGMAGLGNGAGTGLTGTQVADTECHPQLDLAETAFGLWVTAKKIPIQGSSHQFYFTVQDNHFDPCVDLSWVTLQGVEQDPAHYDPMAMESAQRTLIFFHRDQLITDASFLLAYDARDITVADNQLEVTYEALAYPRVTEGPTQKITYKYADGALRQETSPTIDVKPLKLDFHTNPPASDAITIPLGNANYSPAIKTYEGNVLADVPMGDGKILCDFYLTQKTSGPSCTNRQKATWPIVNEGPAQAPTNSDSKSNSEGKTNFAAFSFSPPPSLRTSYFPSGNINPEDTFPDESVVQVGPYFVDTRGDTVKISNNSSTVVLGDGVAELRDEPLFTLDKSRWPQDLKVSR